MAINNGIGRVWAANAGDEGRPAGVGPVWIENIDAITPSGSGGSTYTGGNGIDVDNTNNTISLDDEAQAAIDSYVTNSGSFLTDADLSGYATETYVTNEIEQATSAFVTSGELDGYATETWVSGQGYMKNLFQAEYGVTSYADIADAFSNNKVVYCSVPTGIHGSDRMAFLAYNQEYGSGDQRNFFEFQYYRSSKDDSIFVYKIFPDDTWTTEERTAGSRSNWNATSGKAEILNKPDLSIYATTSEMEEYVTEETSAFITSAEVPEVPTIKDFIAGNGINISATSGDVTISADTSVLATQADLGPYATQTWTAQNYFPIDGLQVVGSSAEASGANIIYIVSGSNA